MLIGLERDTGIQPGRKMRTSGFDDPARLISDNEFDFKHPTSWPESNAWNLFLCSMYRPDASRYDIRRIAGARGRCGLLASVMAMTPRARAFLRKPRESAQRWCRQRRRSGQPPTSVAEYGWVASPVKTGLRPPPPAADGLGHRLPPSIRRRAAEARARVMPTFFRCATFARIPTAIHSTAPSRRAQFS